MRFSQLFEGKGKPQVDLGYGDLVTIIDQTLSKCGLKKSLAVNSIVLAKILNDPKLQKHREAIVNYANTDYHINKVGQELFKTSVDKKNVSKFVSKVPSKFEDDYKTYGEKIKKTFDELYKEFCTQQSKQISMDLK